MVLVFSFVSFSGVIEVSVLVEGVAGSTVGCCSAGWCSSGISRIWLYAWLMLLVQLFLWWLSTALSSGNSFSTQTLTALDQECACSMVKSNYIVR